MRLFDFIEQDYAIRLATHLLGELPTFVEPNVARWRADQARNRMFLHVFAHVDANERLFAVEQKLRERLGEFRFADARWAKEQERTIRLVRIREPSARTTDGVRHERDCLVLPDDALVQRVFNMQQFVALAGHHLAYGNARCA